MKGYYYRNIIFPCPGWWLAANEEGMNGWVPATYLEPLYSETTSPTVNERVKPGEGKVVLFLPKVSI